MLINVCRKNEPPKLLKSVIDEIVKLGNLLKQEKDEDLLAVPGSPATNAMINSVRKKFGDAISPMYAELLSIYDGIENFDWMDVSLVSVNYLLNHPALDEDWGIEDWKTIDYWPGQLFIFGQSDSNPHLLAFDLNKRHANGEYAVVHFDANGLIGKPYDHLTAYLMARRNWYRKTFFKHFY